MKNLLLLPLLCLLSLILSAQPRGARCDYDELLRQGKAEAQKGAYPSALLKFNSARRCDPSKGEEVDAEIQKVFDGIEGQRLMAVDAKNKVDATLVQLLKEQAETRRQRGLAEQNEKKANLQADAARIARDSAVAAQLRAQREKAKADKALEDLKKALETVDLERKNAAEARDLAVVSEKLALLQADSARIARDSAVAAQKRAQETLIALKSTTEEVVRFVLEDAKKLILNLDYEAAWIKLRAAGRLKALTREVALALLEPAFWHAEAGHYPLAAAMLDTIAGPGLLNNSSVKTLLRQLPQLDSTAKRLQLRECIRMLNEAAYVDLQRRYYPVMLPVTGREFRMGDVMGDSDTTDSVFDEKVHPVRLSNFEIATTETTIWHLSIYCATTGIALPKFIDASNREDPGNKPGVQVSWYDAVAYANWLNARYWLATKPPLDSAITGDEERGFQLDLKAPGFRLPTEAEWEYAARGGGKKVRFGNGKDTARTTEINFNGSAFDDDYSFYVKGESRNRTSAAGSLKSPNALGLHDMSGNVWEWCWDWYETYPSKPTTDYAGPESGVRRVLRGGSWGLGAEDCRVAFRLNTLPFYEYFFYGFRLARTF